MPENTQTQVAHAKETYFVDSHEHALPVRFLLVMPNNNVVAEGVCFADDQTVTHWNDGARPISIWTTFRHMQDYYRGHGIHVVFVGDS